MSVRPPAVAGLFYPSDAAVLAADIRTLLLDAEPAVAARPAPQAVIAPHAGYVYSGSTAALAYAALAHHRGRVARVIVAGPTHRVGIAGIALPGHDYFATPLGDVKVDDAVSELEGLPAVFVRPDVHEHEHSIEVHVPFIQLTLGDVPIIPLAVGDVHPTVAAEVFDRVWSDDTLLVVSSDLSHYLSEAEAHAIDRTTIDQMLTLDATIEPLQACGVRPVNGLLTLARSRGLTAELLGYCTSADTAGDSRRVVGYASIAFDAG